MKISISSLLANGNNTAHISVEKVENGENVDLRIGFNYYLSDGNKTKSDTESHVFSGTPEEIHDAIYDNPDVSFLADLFEV